MKNIKELDQIFWYHFYIMYISQLMRLLEYDVSKEFKIIVNIVENNKKYDNIEINEETNIIINTTINRARIISRNIDELYISDQTIDHYEIKLSNIQDENISQKVVEVFNILLKSIGQEIMIKEDLQFIFLIIEHHLGEELNGNNNNNNNNNNDDDEFEDFNFDDIFNENSNNGDEEIGYADLLFMYNIK